MKPWLVRSWCRLVQGVLGRSDTAVVVDDVATTMSTTEQDTDKTALRFSYDAAGVVHDNFHNYDRVRYFGTFPKYLAYSRWHHVSLRCAKVDLDLRRTCVRRRCDCK